MDKEKITKEINARKETLKQHIEKFHQLKNELILQKQKLKNEIEELERQKKELEESKKVLSEKEAHYEFK